MNDSNSGIRVILPARWGSIIIFAIFAIFTVLSAPSVFAITLKGSNGRAVEFAFIKSATPKGITAQMVADGPVLGIPWEKLDLAALENDQKMIYDAYLRAKEGETIDLNIGPGMSGDAPSAVPGKPGETTPAPAPAPSAKYPGWIDTTIGDTAFMLQMPSGEARGILLISLGDYGESFKFVAGHERGNGDWSDFQNKHDLALLTYSRAIDKNESSPEKIDDFVFAGKGSGKSVISAISAFAGKTKQPGLTDLPIALYGADRTGAAFVYNFVQWLPDRVLAAVVSKGAFYDAEPTEASAKVPILFIWGQYCNKHEIWKSENSAAPVLAKVAPMKANWTNGREFRGRSEQNPVVEHFGKQYLLQMIALRLPEKEARPTPKSDEKPGVETEGGKSAPAPAVTGGAPAPVGKPEAPVEKPETPKVLNLDRSKGSVGNLETGEVLKITDPDAVLGENETFLPDAGIGKMWKQFIEGEFEAPLPEPPLK